jgi:hypothetical protein
MYNQLETPQLMRLHDTLNKALGLTWDAVNNLGSKPPEWLEQASEDVKAMYAEIWARRSPESPEGDDKAA